MEKVIDIIKWGKGYYVIMKQGCTSKREWVSTEKKAQTLKREWEKA